MKNLFSIVIALMISTALSFALSYLIISTFQLSSMWYVGIFPLIYFILLCIDKVTNAYITSKRETTRRIIEIEKAKYQQIDDLICYKCRTPNKANILINKSNIFTCSNCGKRNKVLIGFKCASINESATRIDMDSAILKGEIHG